MKRLLKKFSALILALVGLSSPVFAAETVVVELNGNAYVTEGAKASVTPAGLEFREGAPASAAVFFSLERPQEKVRLALKARGNGELTVICGEKKFPVRVDGRDFKTYEVGEVAFPRAGYQRVDVRVPVRASGTLGSDEASVRVSELRLDGIEGKTTFVRDFSPYWGRRGPSVHLRYEAPEDRDYEYFYNEVVVPKGEDPIGSYYMACGFGEGYFGFQVNTPVQRRILFSVWSPFQTDNPKEIPEESRIVLKKKGAGVRTGEFGNEGSGGQSYLVYPWRAGTPYKFLARVRPLNNGFTEYTGYFFATEEREWKLIASFLRPQTTTWLVRPYSFLENFNGDQGWRRRSVNFKNQWLRDANGEWFEPTVARFTCDQTGAKRARIDYAGGTAPDGKSFFLKNCGFFDDATASGEVFTREASGEIPEIDFAALEKLAN